WQIAALNPADAVQVQTVQTHLQAANDAFAVFTASLVRDMAFTEATLAVLDAEAIAAPLQTLPQVLATIDIAPLRSLADSLHAFLDGIKNALKLPDDLTIDTYKSFIHTGLVQLRDNLSAFDPTSLTEVLQDVVKLINEPFKK